MKLLYEKMGTKAKKTLKALKYKETIDNLTEFVLINNKGKKTYVELMNILTFNKRHIPQLTWSQLTNNQIPNTNINNNNVENIVKVIDDNIIPIISSTKKIDYKLEGNKILCDSDYSNSELSSDDDSDDSDESDLDELPTITLNKQTFILDKNFLYTIVYNNKKGELYGSLVNGKFRRLKPKDIDV